MNKRRPGRPELPSGEAKERSIRLRLRPDDYEKVKKAAQAEGMTVSAWARQRLLSGL